jgi:hypothetical protein
VLRVALLNVGSEQAMYWLLLGYVMLYSGLAGFFVETNRQPNDPIAPLLFEIMPGTLYLTVVSRLISIVLDTGYGTRAVGALLVRVTVSLLLLSLLLRLLVVMCNSILTHCWLNAAHGDAVRVQSLLFYASTAVFVGVYRGDKASSKSDINYVPRQVQVYAARVGKCAADVAVLC